MKEFTLGKSHMNVHSVASVLADQETSGNMKWFTLGKRRTNVNKVFGNQETLEVTKKSTEGKYCINVPVTKVCGGQD